MRKEALWIDPQRDLMRAKRAGGPVCLPDQGLVYKLDLNLAPREAADGLIEDGHCRKRIMERDRVAVLEPHLGKIEDRPQ